MAWERSGVPGGQVRTSWFDRDVPAMWRTLENQQSDDHWRLVAGWRKAAELTVTHLRRLEQYRANLAEAWPPDRNKAAAAYVARLDFLIQNVRTTHDVAAANYSTLAATVGALATARRDLKPLYDDWVAKSRAIKDHADLAALNAAAEAPTVIGAAPATAQDLERLNNRARAIMYTLSHTLIEAEAAIRQPPTYSIGTFRDPGNPDVYGKSRPITGEAGGSIVASGSGTSPDAVNRLASSQKVTPIDPTATLTNVPQPFPEVSTAYAPGSHAMSPKGTALDPMPASREGSLSSSTFPGRGTKKPLAPGGVIGAVPSGVTQPSQERNRVNPVGGVIGNYRRPGQESVGQPVYAPIAGQPKEERSRRIRGGEPDTHWEVADGVPEVIQPRKQARFDPGPVIGLNR